MKTEIAKYRKQREISQDKLAAMLGVTSATISRYETGATDISAETLKRISQILSVSIDVLLNNTTNIVDLNLIDENQKEVIQIISKLPKAKVDKVVGFCQALLDEEK